MSPLISRGFGGRRRRDVDPSRIPPGQYVVDDFPVLSAGPTPSVSLDTWTFSITGAVDEPTSWSWEEFLALSSEEIRTDIHCVTKWSKLDTAWRGVSVDFLLEGTEVLERLVPRAPLTWRVATVHGLEPETPSATTLIFDVPDWPGHLAGQHVDVRLTAEDGYQAERSYSIASAPEDSHLALTVERIDDGEVSPYLTDELHAGDELELRGPIGGYFTWEAADGGPLLLLAGGSGLVPL